MGKKMANLALFDLDHTLLDVDSDHSWGQFLVERGLVDAIAFKKANDDFYQAYLKGVLDPVAYNEFVANFLKQHPMASLQAWRDEYLESKIKPYMRQKAIEQINDHKNQGDTVLITSSTNDFVVMPIANLFGVADSQVFATRLEIVDNAYTGKVVGRPNFQEGKIYHLENFVKDKAKQGVVFDKTYAYSDSKNDLPLLSWADVAICVTPDKTLMQIAQDNNWQIVDWATT